MFSTWREAMHSALYAESGFYRRTAGPAASFRTSTHDNTHFSAAVARLLLTVDAELDHPQHLDLVDVGCGRGELLVDVLTALPSEVVARVRPFGVEVAARPRGLTAQIEWVSEIPTCRGLLIANEWLDVIPLNVIEVGPDGMLYDVAVDADGTESLGAASSQRDVEWLRTWWPISAPGDRAEVGLDRDLAWAEAVGRVDAGLAVCIDYSHERSTRPVGGSLIGYADGRTARPRPDTSMDLTAHVAWDSLAAALTGPTTSRTQAEMLRPDLSGGNPLAALESRSRARVLTDPGGLGALEWLLCPVGVRLPGQTESDSARSDKMQASQTH